MNEPIAMEIARLKNANVDELKKKFSELFGHPPTENSKRMNLWRQIAYRLQENRFGGLSIQTQEIIACEIQNLQTHIKPTSNNHGKTKPTNKAHRDRRIPMPGTILSRNYKGQEHQVKALEQGFEYNGKVFFSLRAVAKSITGSHLNDYTFFPFG